MNKKYNVAVIGATGAVGRETLETLAERNFPINNIFAVASDRSLGKKVSFGASDLHIDLIEHVNWDEIDIVFSSAGSEITKLFTEKLPQNVIVIDKTSVYRLDKDVPLIIPEVNIEDIHLYTNKNIIANPNCCVIPLAIILKPLDNLNKIKRVVVSTYQSISGAGKNSMEALYEQTKKKFVYIEESEEDEQESTQNLAFNIIPQIGPLEDNGYSDEENKIILELNRILGDEIKITATSVRVPVFIGHCFSVNIEFEDIFYMEDIENTLRNLPGVILSHKAITPTEISGSDEVFVSRLRQDNSSPNSINLWIAADNLRKGAALNAVQIAETLIKLL
jgi:aspartate-semialdehyde dehydrogenase